jgi:hypothetical protein
MGSTIHKLGSIVVITPISKLSNLVKCEKFVQQVVHLTCIWTFQLMFSYTVHQKIGTMHPCEFKCHGAIGHKHRSGEFMALYPTLTLNRIVLSNLHTKCQA